MIPFSHFARSVRPESAFDVLAVARRLKAAGKDVIELEIGDSPYPSSSSATVAGMEAIRQDLCHYGPSAGLPQFRQAAAEYLQQEYHLPVTEENIVAGPGAKIFEQLFCEAFVNPNDRVLVFTPHFPTYPPNVFRRGGRIVFSRLDEQHDFRPNIEEVRAFVESGADARAIILNSPHNPTGGVMREEDVRAIADLVRGRPICVLSDEPYDRMVWQGAHHTILAQEGMLEQCVGVYTFSKSYSMSGWRLGFAVSSAPIVALLANLINTCLSCVPPFTQMAGIAALRHDRSERESRMEDFRRKVYRLADALDRLDGIRCRRPAGTFYAFANVHAVCRRFGITSYGLAMYFLEGADDRWGVACLGGECFGEAGRGYIRFSCAEPDDRLELAVHRIQEALARPDRIHQYLQLHPHYRLPDSL